MSGCDHGGGTPHRGGERLVPIVGIGAECVQVLFPVLRCFEHSTQACGLVPKCGFVVKRIDPLSVAAAVGQAQK